MTDLTDLQATIVDALGDQTPKGVFVNDLVVLCRAHREAVVEALKALVESELVQTNFDWIEDAHRWQLTPKGVELCLEMAG